MATKMRVSTRYGSHMPVLMEALRRTLGNILELGGGVFSTPLIHWTAMMEGRHAVTLENFPSWHKFLKAYEAPYHKVELVERWENADVSGEWDVVLVDLTPDDMRVEMVKKLANTTRYIIIHDSNGRYNKVYHYETIYPLFKYRYIFDKTNPHTTILSNFHDLEGFI